MSESAGTFTICVAASLVLVGGGTGYCLLGFGGLLIGLGGTALPGIFLGAWVAERLEL